ncbi:replication protein P [Pantoea ananatis]|uniref:replication protein P n=1 Tax=Pantoea ananas TaxID=553 RepID=UPI0035E45473
MSKFDVKKRSRANISSFWLSPRQFIPWYKDGESGAVGLPDVNALYGMVMRDRA